MKTLIQPEKKNIKYWIKSLIPQKDVWFFRNKPSFADCNILTIDKYLEQYDLINYNNAYCHWLIKKYAKYVIVDESNSWIVSLNQFDRDAVYREQIKCERGLIIENIQEFENVNSLTEMMCDDKMILSNATFKNLSNDIKESIVINYAKEQDDWSTYKLPKEIKSFSIANKFIDNDGCNCLATVLFAITKNKQYLQQWVNQDEFIRDLGEYVEMCDGVFQYGDVVIFYDDNNIQHSCFALNDRLFLNKSGQSKFNPILVLTFEDIKNDWQTLKYKVLRKR